MNNCFHANQDVHSFNTENCRKVPNREMAMKSKPLYTSEILYHESGCSLTIYKGKKNKNVYLLSSMHPCIVKTSLDYLVLQQIENRV